MKMQPRDFHVFYVGLTELRAAAHFSGMTAIWPDTIVDDGKTYKFASQEMMEDWMIGSFAGHARYQLI